MQQSRKNPPLSQSEGCSQVILSQFDLWKSFPRAPSATDVFLEPSFLIFCRIFDEFSINFKEKKQKNENNSFVFGMARPCHFSSFITAVQPLAWVRFVLDMTGIERLPWGIS